MNRLQKEEIDPNTQYQNEEEYYEEDNGEEMDEEEGGETAQIGQNQESDGAGYTPGNASAGFDKLQINNNFQYGGVNRLLPQQQLGQGKIRPQSAKTGDDQQLKFQQQYNQAWADPQQQYSYQVNSNNSMGQPPPMIGAFNAGQPYVNNGYYQAGPQVGNYLQKKRPTTASRRNNVQFGVINKKQFGSKNPSTIDLEISRLRPRIIHQEREKLFDDAMKQKMQANYLKDENMKLKTKIQQLDSELTKKERLVDELLQQESFQGQAPQKMNKMKLEGHLSINLKRKIRELQINFQERSEEVESLKRNIKSTKIAEIEIENKMYMDECIRLRHQLEEVIKSKDTFADPEELKIIEEKFQNQDLMINNLKNENQELAIAYQKKDQESQQLSMYIQQNEQRQKKAVSAGKEKLKLKKIIKEKERENQKVKLELQNQKVQNEEYRVKIEELVKKNQSNFNSRPQTANYYQPPSNNVQSNSGTQLLENEVKRLRGDITEKDTKIRENNQVVQSLQSKLQEKINELTRESSEKSKYKELSDKYQTQIAQLEAQFEEGGMKQVAKKILNQSKENEQKPTKQQPVQKTSEVTGAKPVKTIACVDPNQLGDLFLELKLKLQTKAFYSNQIKDFFFKPFQAEGQVSVNQMKEILQVNGIDEKRSLLAARYLIEPKKLSEIAFSEDTTASQKDVISELQNFIGHYNVFTDANKVKKMNESLQKLFAKCKGTLKDALQVEDYEEDGTLPIYAFKDVFETLDLEVDDDLMEYIISVIYSKSESIEKMKYQVLLDLIDGKVVNGQLSVGSEGQGRKRPESSSPEKLKARNKEKYTNNSQPTEQDKKANKEEGDDEYDDNYEDEFEKLLDKDDNEESSGKNNQKQNDNSKQIYNKPNNAKESQEGDDEEGIDGEEEDYINEEEMLDIAEKCFVKVAEAILESGISVRQAFSKFIIQQDLEGEVLELLSPIGFLEGIKDLGITDLEEVEVACLMRVLTKADLEHAILLRELIVIMENFGIQDDDGLGQAMTTENYENEQEDVEANEQAPQQPGQKQKKTKKKKGTQKPMDLGQLDEKSIKILAKMILALMEMNATLDEFFDGVIYEQLVKTKTKQNTVEIINTNDFFNVLQQRGVRKSNKEHDNLTKFLQLDPNYPGLIMLKKVAKCLDEMAKNEELMAGILQGFEDEEGINAAEGQVEGEGGQQRLITIGEDGEEANYDTNKQDSKAAHGQKKLSAIQQQDGEEDENEYDQNDYEENEDDYAF